MFRELSSSKDFYDYRWLTLTFDPVTSSMSPMSRGPVTSDYIFIFIHHDGSKNR